MCVALSLSRSLSLFPRETDISVPPACIPNSALPPSAQSLKPKPQALNPEPQPRRVYAALNPRPHPAGYMQRASRGVIEERSTAQWDERCPLSLTHTQASLSLPLYRSFSVSLSLPTFLSLSLRGLFLVLSLPLSASLPLRDLSLSLSLSISLSLPPPSAHLSLFKRRFSLLRTGTGLVQTPPERKENNFKRVKALYLKVKASSVLCVPYSRTVAAVLKTLLALPHPHSGLPTMCWPNRRDLPLPHHPPCRSVLFIHSSRKGPVDSS